MAKTNRTLHLVSLGCARNQVDSEWMLGRLADAGWQILADPAAAHTIVVNTCSFIQAAADESIDTILALAHFKRSGKCRRLIVAGCLPERYRQEIAAALPEVDLFLGTGAYGRILDAVDGRLPPGSCLLPDPEAIGDPDPFAPRRLLSPASAYLKIAEGCDRRCTYCIIPRLRGRQKSRPLSDLTAEARGLVGRDVREIVLVAQDSTFYGQDLVPRTELADLLAALSAAAPEAWLRVLYGHPRSIRRRTVQAMARLENVLSYYDLPIQHASDPILRRMGRGYTRQGLRRLFARIRAADPQACLRTTAIVGFPGESEEDFETLMAFAAEVRFDHLGVFTYSDAEDLPSHHLAPKVSAAVATRRRDRLMRQQRRISAAANRRHLGRILPVLVEQRVAPGVYVGRTPFQAPEVDGVTYVRGGGLEAGRILPVRITAAMEYDLQGDAL
jgi:ribosomal protein S12 methylthiotransferase